jgi:hypothetical protein
VALFCSIPTGIASTARYLLDLPAGASGRLKVVALDTTGLAPSVVQSPEVRFNGGVAAPYPATVLHASSVHQSLRVQVAAIGSGLGTATSMSIVALDSSWTLPVVITARSDTLVTGIATAAGLLPACRVNVGTDGRGVSSAALAADEEPASLGPTSCTLTFSENLLPPPPPQQVPHHDVAIQPKDLAWTRGFVDFSSNKFAVHLFYIRHSFYNILEDNNEKN